MARTLAGSLCLNKVFGMLFFVKVKSQYTYTTVFEHPERHIYMHVKPWQQTSRPDLTHALAPANCGGP